MKSRKEFLIFASVLLLVGGSVVAFFYHKNSPPTEYARPTSKELMNFVGQYKPQLAREIQEATAQKNAVKTISQTSHVRLAIGWLGLSGEESNQRTSDLITADLSAAKNLELVDRQSLDTLLHEQQMSLSGVVRANSAIRIGKLLHADWFLVGSAGVIHGSNYIVERIVDARTGQSLDIKAFPVGNDLAHMARDLADFVRECRANVSRPKPKTYLVFGEFRDMNANNPHPEFQEQLFSYLTAAFQGNNNVALLERENVDMMMQELRLDLAGLTDESGASSPPPPQWAFWTADGIYQFYQNNGSDVELVLTVWQIFNKSSDITLRGPPGEAIFHQAKMSIDQLLTNAGPALLPPTRSAEFGAQMTSGKKICGLNQTVVTSPGVVPKTSMYYINDMGRERQTQDLERGIRAFEAAVLLEPDNLEAKMYLANCLWHPYINRKEEAFEYFREIAETPTNLLESFYPGASTNSGATFQLRKARQLQAVGSVDAALCHPENPAASNWIHQAQLLTTVPGQSNYYESYFHQEKAAHGLTNPDDDFVSGIRDALRGLKGKTYFASWPNFPAYLKRFKPDPDEGLHKLNIVISNMQEEFPQTAPYLQLTVCFSLEASNNPFQTDMVQTMTRLAEHLEQVSNPGRYFDLIASSGFRWSYGWRQYLLAEQMIEAKQRASTISPEVIITTHDKLSQAYAFMKLERWQDALSVLTNLPPPPIDPGESGPWGFPTYPYLASPDINYCRGKLGLPKDADGDLPIPGYTYVNFLASAPFACSDGSVWVAAGSKLFQLDYDWHTNQVFDIPAGGYANKVVCAGPAQIWIGTSDAGLIEFNKTTHESIVMNGRNGLYRDTIDSLCLQGDTLWIGFSGLGGGVGQLDLQTHKLSAFGASLSKFGSSREVPPVQPNGVIADAAGRVFIPASTPPTYIVSTNRLVPQFQPRIGQLIQTEEYSAAGILGSHQYGPILPHAPEYEKYGLTVKTGNGPWQLLGADAGVPAPNVTALALDGKNLWLGGWGFVSVLDLEKMSVRKTFFVRQDVCHLEIAGGYLWLQGGIPYPDRDVVRIPLSVAQK
jgi:Curli production assembly/transport component CsgG